MDTVAIGVIVSVNSSTIGAVHGAIASAVNIRVTPPALISACEGV